MPVLDPGSLYGLIERTLDYVDNRLLHHGRRVAFIVKRMLDASGDYSLRERQQICYLALLHDIGAYKTEEIDKMLEFETENVWAHSIYGALFIKYLSPLRQWAPAILNHHTEYTRMDMQEPCARVAQMIHLADRVDILVANSYSAARLDAYLTQAAGSRFDPATVALFRKSGVLDRPLTEIADSAEEMEAYFAQIDLAEEVMTDFIRMLIFTIDFRSHHTVTHTITTTAVSFQTAKLLGLDPKTVQQVRFGAMLHDLGKIGMPVEILEFSGKLSPQAMRVMRTHVDLTGRILGDCVDSVTTRIALRHHEKLDGSGYPEGLHAADLTLPERIVAVADIVSALSGTRSYKAAYPKEKTLGLIAQIAASGQIDAQVVQTVTEHYDFIMEKVDEISKPAIRNYEQIQKEYQQMMNAYANA